MDFGERGESIFGLFLVTVMRTDTMQRREFLLQTGLVSLAPTAAQAGTGSRSNVKITDIKTYLVGDGERAFRGLHAELFYLGIPSR
jgi:hypothetical protein